MMLRASTSSVLATTKGDATYSMVLRAWPLNPARGACADSLGAPVTVALCGTACVLAASVFITVLPGLRPEARRLILAQQMEIP